jgi:hypothetical protein
MKVSDFLNRINELIVKQGDKVLDYRVRIRVNFVEDIADDIFTHERDGEGLLMLDGSQCDYRDE